MINDRTRVRLRAALDQWFVVVVVALLALALVGGWAAYGAATATDGDPVESEPTDTWTTSGEFEHSATVQEENEAFSVGTDLADRSLYFSEVAPELEATFQFAYDAPDGDVDVDVETERVIRSVGDDGNEHWAVNETLAETGEEGLAPGEELATNVTLDVPATINDTASVEDSLDSSVGTTEIVVSTTVSMTGTIDGEPVDHVETYALEIDPDDSTYEVEAVDESGGQPAEQPATAATTETENDSEDTSAAGFSGLLGPLVPALVAIASVCSLGALAVTKATGRLAPADRDLERVRTQHEREAFDDWISSGSLPDDIRDRSRIEVSTLEDLVDVAIDCDRRVLEDEPTGEFYVVDGESLYVYESGERDGEQAG
ncbi:DUF5305 domain-containing protein [Natronolimnohabitans innermongolicus]|uniref:DUF5305 domain-containing protein n=1 Tax=Natronolimnohabitans innermongolicus JCM 12255 TaxID=1227499 RepID=L9XFX7_9EURY|nr:DUF5305 domain-containing protein [Natronolimnohabitans innermongolicus]ELY59578.1 hypothetical protein C493_05120 [Natronolimnohabitans innermongolicus JCM 12255]